MLYCNCSPCAACLAGSGSLERNHPTEEEEERNHPTEEEEDKIR
jgi:hypothetical protein